MDRPFEQSPATPAEQHWIPDATISQLRSLIRSRLDGQRERDGDLELISSQLASAARDEGFTPERMLIALRALWRDFALSQHDRLQLAGLYDHLVRRTIDKYYED